MGLYYGYYCFPVYLFPRISTQLLWGLFLSSSNHCPCRTPRLHIFYQPLLSSLFDKWNSPSSCSPLNFLICNSDFFSRDVVSSSVLINSCQTYTPLPHLPERISQRGSAFSICLHDVYYVWLIMKLAWVLLDTLFGFVDAWTLCWESLYTSGHSISYSKIPSTNTPLLDVTGI